MSTIKKPIKLILATTTIVVGGLLLTVISEMIKQHAGVGRGVALLISIAIAIAWLVITFKICRWANK